MYQKPVKIQELLGAVQKLEDLMQRYAARKRPDGSRRPLDEDIRMASLQNLCPEDLKKHLQLNSSRLVSYEALRSEIVLYAEARGSNPAPQSQQRGPDDMDVDSFQKGWPKGGGRGGKKGDKGQPKGGGKGGKQENPNKDKECHVCGRKGHLKKDCWYKDQPEKWLKKKDGPKGGGKDSKKGKKGGKGAGALDDQPEEEQGGFDMGHFDICQLTTGSPEWDAEGWIRMNLDTGCARSVYPMDAEYGKEGEAREPIKMKTASGEICETGCNYRVCGKGEWGEFLRVPGVKAPVHKPLTSAGAVADKGADMILNAKGGFIVHAGTPLLKELRAAQERILRKHKYVGTTEVHKERGVYNFYVQGPKRPATPKDVCAGDEQGGTRRGQSL